MTVHQVSRALSKKRNGVYLRATDVSLFCVDQAPRGDWADTSPLSLAPTAPAVQISRIVSADAQVINCCLFRIRVRSIACRRARAALTLRAGERRERDAARSALDVHALWLRRARGALACVLAGVAY